jgi:hypothetical protein
MKLFKKTVLREAACKRAHKAGSGISPVPALCSFVKKPELVLTSLECRRIYMDIHFCMDTAALWLGAAAHYPCHAAVAVKKYI